MLPFTVGDAQTDARAEPGRPDGRRRQAAPRPLPRCCRSRLARQTDARAKPGRPDGRRRQAAPL